MSIQAVAWALDQFVPDPHQKLILISLANHANHNTGLCFPGLAVIAREASCDRRTVIRRLPLLEQAGLISINRSSDGKQKLRNAYRLLMPGSVPQTLPPSVHQTLPPLQSDTGGSVYVDTRGSDSVVTTNNRHLTIKNKPPRSPVRTVSTAANGRAAAHVKSDRTEVVQARIVERLGAGDRARGWLLFGELTDIQRDGLTAQQRGGRLTDDDLHRLRLQLGVDRK